MKAKTQNLISVAVIAGVFILNYSLPAKAEKAMSEFEIRSELSQRISQCQQLDLDIAWFKSGLIGAWSNRDVIKQEEEIKKILRCDSLKQDIEAFNRIYANK